MLVFFLFFLFVTFSGRTAKSLLANVLVIKKTCDQDLTHSLDTRKYISVIIVPEVAIRDTCDTCYNLHGNQHLQHSKKQKKLPDSTARNSEISYTDS